MTRVYHIRKKNFIILISITIIISVLAYECLRHYLPISTEFHKTYNSRKVGQNFELTKKINWYDNMLARKK